MARWEFSTPSIAFIFLGILYITLISAKNSDQSMARREKFASDNPTYDVMEGDTIQLVCIQPKSLLNIERVEKNKYVIHNSTRTEFTPGTFSFSYNAPTGILTIANITRSFGKEYICTAIDPDLNKQSLTLNVIYKPSNITPACDSNYPFHDVGGSTPAVSYFTCTKSDANPQVRLSMLIYDENGTERNVTRYGKLSNGTLLYKFNQSLISNQSMFVCEASQEFPSPYENHSYTEQCSSHGAVPSFLVIIEPFNPKVDRGENVTLTCASRPNIGGLSLEWTGKPDNCREFNEVNATNRTMVCSELLVNATLGCTASYRGKNTLNSTSIYVRASKPDTEPTEKRWYFYLVAGSGMIILSLIAGMIVRSKGRRPSTRTNSTTTESHDLSEDNSSDGPHHTEGTNQNKARLNKGYAAMTEMVDYRTHPGMAAMAAMPVNTKSCQYESI